MITLTENALDLGTECPLVSCHFDVESINADKIAEAEAAWGVTLPEKLHTAVPKRQAEFIAGRYCVNRAFQLSSNEQPVTIPTITIGEKRQPLWPQGYTGSITHSHGFAAATISNSVRSIGIDSEYIIKSKTANNVASHILTKNESFTENQNVARNSDHYLTLIFSAKESIFKCLYPLVGKYFDFKDAVIYLSSDRQNHFSFQLQKNLSEEFCESYEGEGIYTSVGNFVHTAVILKR